MVLFVHNICSHRDFMEPRKILKKGEDIDMFKKILAFLVFLALTFSLSACNTIRGVGKDIQKGGEIIQKAAE